jgi:hypothetical protein
MNSNRARLTWNASGALRAGRLDPIGCAFESRLRALADRARGGSVNRLTLSQSYCLGRAPFQDWRGTIPDLTIDGIVPGVAHRHQGS